MEHQGATERLSDGALLGARVRTLREDRGFSQRELARRAEVQVSDISRLERGLTAQPRLSLCVGLARALGVTVSQMLGEVELPPVDVLGARTVAELREALDAIGREATRVARLAASAASSLRR